jgi:hypothetical protein
MCGRCQAIIYLINKWSLLWSIRAKNNWLVSKLNLTLERVLKQTIMNEFRHQTARVDRIIESRKPRRSESLIHGTGTEFERHNHLDATTSFFNYCWSNQWSHQRMPLRAAHMPYSEIILDGHLSCKVDTKLYILNMSTKTSIPIIWIPCWAGQCCKAKWINQN